MIQDKNDKYLRKQESRRLTDQYNESHGMILKDKEIAAAIDIIGEFSHCAKRKILYGEVKIDKQVLKSLSAWQDEDILRLAMEIENGSFEKKPPPSSAKNAQPGALNQNKFDNTEMRSTLRKCINMLEKLYKQM